jgi:hypothetical protein
VACTPCRRPGDATLSLRLNAGLARVMPCVWLKLYVQLCTLVSA